MRPNLQKMIYRLAALSAFLGGLVLIAIVIATCFSILGRAFVSFGSRPISGIYEYTQMGIAFSIFAFLPWCHLKQGNARVDLFKNYFGAKLNKALDVAAELLLLFLAGFIAWRLALGMLDKKSFLETTIVLQMPLWIAYAACLFGAVIFVLVCLYRCQALLFSKRELNS